MAKDSEIKGKVLQSLRDFFKEKEVGSWKDLLSPKKEKSEDDEGESEDEEESCDCGKSSCPECGKKPKGVAVIEETVIIGKPKK